MTNHKNIREQICAAARRLYDRNMLAGVDGNISVRVSDAEIVITPSGQAKAFLSPSDLVVVDLSGKVQSGRPSTEMEMHLFIYRTCASAKTIVHAHPPMALAWSVAFPDLQALPNRCLTELVLCVGEVPVVPLAIPGTVAMGTVLGPYLPKHRVMILARHGALSWGEDMSEAVNGMEHIEHAATTLYHAKMLGQATEIGESDMARLLKVREELGPRSL